MSKKFWMPKFNYYSKRLSMWQEKLWREANGSPFMGIFDNIAGRKAFEYVTVDPRMPITQKMTAACVWNACNAIPQGPALDTTITSMGNTIYDADSIDSWRVYGYNSGVDYYSYANFGSIGSATYTDGGSNSRTISAIYYHEPGSPNARADDLVLSMNATSVPDTDTTFVSLEYNGVSYTRTSRSVYSGTFGSASSWIWQNINPNGPTTGNPAVKIFI